MDIQWYIKKFYEPGWDEFKKLTPEMQADVSRAAKEGLEKIEREIAWGQRRREQIREQARDFDTRYRLRQEGVNLAPAPLPKPEDLSPYNDLREQVRQTPIWTRKLPPEGMTVSPAKTHPVETYLKDFAKFRDKAPPEMQPTLERRGKRDYGELQERSKRRDAAWWAKMNKQSTEREKRMAQYDRVEDEEFKNKVAAQDKRYKEARARIAANNKKLKRMGLL